MSCLVDTCPETVKFRSGFFAFCSEDCAHNFWQPLPLSVKESLNALLSIQGKRSREGGAERESKHVRQLSEDEQLRESLIYLMQHQAPAAQQVLRYLDSATLYALYTSNEMIAEFVQTKLLKTDFLRLIETENFTPGRWPSGKRSLYADPQWKTEIQQFAEARSVPEKNINWLKVWTAIRTWHESWLKMTSFLLQPIGLQEDLWYWIPMHGTKAADTPAYSGQSYHQSDYIDKLRISIYGGTLHRVNVERNTVMSDLVRYTDLDGSLQLWMSIPLLFLSSARYEPSPEAARQIHDTYYPVPFWDAGMASNELAQRFGPPIEMFNDIFALRQNILDAFEIEK